MNDIPANIKGTTPEETRQLQMQCAAFETWIHGSRRADDTWLVTRGHIIKPPFTTEYETQDGLLQITLTGEGDTAIFLCNRVINSRFRPAQIGFFRLNPDNAVVERRTLAALGASKQKILAAFPPGSEFTSDELYDKITKADNEGGQKSQAHARRRWKELKFDFGFDVDFNAKKQRYYRGAQEAPVRDPILRPDDSRIRSAFWDKLAAVAIASAPDGVLRCNLCSAQIIEETQDENHTEGESHVEGGAGVETSLSVDTAAGGVGDTGSIEGAAADVPRSAPDSSATAEDVTGVTNLTQSELVFSDVGLLDHRRPVPQGGDDLEANLQVICRTCNNKKNTVCRNCPYGFRCDTCYLAFPENTRRTRLVVVLDNDIARALEKVFQSPNLEGAVRDYLISLANEQVSPPLQ